jgi:hypothetical protein
VAELTALPTGLTGPTSISAGQDITVTAVGFQAGESVEIVMRSTPIVLGRVTAGPDGAISAAVTIPATAPSGDHHLYAFGLTSRTGVQLAVTVGVPDSLAFTGSSTAPLMALALMLLLAGVLLRRRATPRLVPVPVSTKR